jgi:hypothetical protein
MKEFLIQALRYALKNDHVVKGKPVVDLEVEPDSKRIDRSPTAQTSRGKARAKT